MMSERKHDDELVGIRVRHLCEQIEASQRQFSHLRSELKRALEEVARSPDSVARDLRTIAEAIVTTLYADMVGAPESKGCARMIEELLKAEIISRKHAAFLHAIRAVGNIAVHPDSEGSILEPRLTSQEVLSVADFLVSVLRWYLARFSNHNIRVGISGSQTEQDGNWSAFCHELGRALVRDGYRILATNAKGVGKAFYQGAVEYLTSQGDPDTLGKCIFAHVGAEHTEQIRKNRENLLQGVDACVFVAGGQGTAEEHHILSSGGVLCIPIGASGGTAQVLWREWERTHLPNYQVATTDSWLRLGQKGIDVLDYVNAVRAILSGYSRGGLEREDSQQPHLS